MTARPPLFDTEPPRASVVASDPLVREGFARGLSDAGLELVDDERSADVVVVDAGSESTKVRSKLRGLARRDAPVVLLLPDEALLRAALAAGASGALLRSADPARIGAAVHAVHQGLTVVDGPVAPRDADDDEPVEELTTREREVLELIATGLSNKRIARRLEISEHTAKFHVNAILGKLDARTRTEAVVTAARQGLLLL